MCLDKGLIWLQVKAKARQYFVDKIFKFWVPKISA